MLERTDRIYVIELGRFLHHSTREIMRFARARKILHHSTGTRSRNRVHWLTPYGATQVIVHIRALQVQWMERHHRDFHNYQVMNARKTARLKARRRAEALK